MVEKLKVGYVQTSPNFGEIDQNFNQVEGLLGDSTADLIVLPELFATGYTFISKKEVQSLAEDTRDKTAQFLIKLANRTNAVIVGGFAERFEYKIFNSAIIASSDGVLGTYRKLHLYYKENIWFSPGNQKINIYKVNDIKIGIMICFDWIFPETARSLAILGADIIAHPANLVLPYCQNAMVTRCLENRVFAITANRIGTEERGKDKFYFTGASQITSYRGEVLSSAPKDECYVDFVEIDIEKARNKKLNEYNDILSDRRSDLYVS